MTDKERQDDFAARLRRIEQTRHDQPPVSAEDLGIAPDPSPYDTPEESYALRNALIWLAIFVATGIGGYVAYGALPEDLRDMIAGRDGGAAETLLAAAVTVDLTAPVDPADQGPAFPSPSVASLQSEPITLSDIATQVTGDTALGQVLPFDRNVSCNLRRPLPAETVMNVRIEDGLLPAPIQAFSDADLADRLLSNVNAVTQAGADGEADGRISGDVQSVDVFLTDTSAPIYLVLQNMGDGILWNIQTAPDVTLAHVAIIATQFSGLVNPPRNTTFEALLVSDFVKPGQSGAEGKPGDCMIQPWRNPQADWVGVEKASAGNPQYQDLIATYTAGHAAYGTWYKGALGVDAGTNLITANAAAHVLLGPTPATPIAYRPIAGQDVHFRRTEHIITGSAAARQQAVEAAHTDLLRAAIGGTMAALDPPEMERVTQ